MDSASLGPRPTSAKHEPVPALLPPALKDVPGIPVPDAEAVGPLALERRGLVSPLDGVDATISRPLCLSDFSPNALPLPNLHAHAWGDLEHLGPLQAVGIRLPDAQPTPVGDLLCPCKLHEKIRLRESSSGRRWEGYVHS